MRGVFTQLADLGQAELRRRHSQMERQETIFPDVVPAPLPAGPALA